jgi:hypothetical protein
MEEQPSGDSEFDGLQSLRQPPELKAAIEEAGPRIRLQLSKAKVHPDDLERFVQDVIVELLRVLT